MKRQRNRHIIKFQDRLNDYRATIIKKEIINKHQGLKNFYIDNKHWVQKKKKKKKKRLIICSLKKEKPNAYGNTSKEPTRK